MSTAETETSVPSEEKVEAKEEAPANADGEPATKATEEGEKPSGGDEAKDESGTKENKENGGNTTSAESSAPESAASAEESKEDPAPECDAKQEDAPVEVEDPELEELFAKLEAHEGDTSFLKRHLTREILDKIKSRKTALGGTLKDCIKTDTFLSTGCIHNDTKLGLFVSDPEGYKTFAELYDPLIKDYHRLSVKKNISHPNSSFGDLEKVQFENLDPDGKHIVSTRIRVGRSLDSYGFWPILSMETIKEIESKLVEGLNSLEGELKGTYYPLDEMSEETQKQLIQDHYLFNGNKDNLHLESGDGYKGWPEGRGIFFNEAKTFLSWVNEEDHLRIISMQEGADLTAVYKRLATAAKALEEKLKFAKDNRLGYMAYCPSNLGTSLRASYLIKIPHLSATELFEETMQKLNLQIRGFNGTRTEGKDGTFDLSNVRRMGMTELQAVTEMHNGVKEVIRMEKELAWRPENVDDMFQHLNNAKSCKSLLKKHLSKEVFESLKEKKTSKEATLGDCILSGVLNLDSGVGLYAADHESYTEFSALFDPVIKEYHKLKASTPITHPEMDFGDLENLEFGDLDPEGEMIVSTRIRVGRSHKDFAFPPVLTKEDRVTMEQKCVEAFNCLDGDLKGSYHGLVGMSKEVQDQMTADHFLFNDNDRFLKAARGYNDWPEGRGIYCSENKNFLVWVNEEDHLRIISMQKGGDLGAVYKRLVTGIKAMEEKLTFARDDRLGYLTFCPTNLGTTLRASVHIKIPHLSTRKDFKSVMDRHKLQARGIHGEHTASEGGVYDISNKRRLGLSEIDAVKEMASGVKEIMRLEKELATGKTKSCSVL